MREPSGFEASFERRLRARASLASRPFDASEVAHAAIATGAARRTLTWSSTLRPSVAWLVLVGLLAVAAAGIVAIGGLPRTAADLQPVLAIGRSDGLYIARADGTAAHRILDDGPFFQPRWSTDGKYIAVTALTDVDANHLIVVRPDGTVVADAVSVFEYRWSPVRNVVAMHALLTNEIRVLSVDDDRSVALPLPDGDVALHSLDWAPDGRRIVVSVGPADGSTPKALWLLNLDGGRPVRFTTASEEPADLPAWAPDGSRIAMVTERCFGATCRPEIRVLDSDTGQRRADVQNVVQPGRPAWSPDGALLAFDALVGGQRDIFVTTADATKVVRLTAEPAAEWLVGWNPDGRSVVIGRNVPDGASSRTEFWSVAVDGSGRMRFVDDAHGVALQPVP